MKRIVLIGILFVFVAFQPCWGYGTQQQESSGGLLDLAFEIATAPCSILAACLGMDGSGSSPQDCYVVCVPRQYVCTRPPVPCYVRVVPSAGSKPPTARTASPRIPAAIPAPVPQARPSVPPETQQPSIRRAATPPSTADAPQTPGRPPVSVVPRPSGPEPLLDAPRTMKQVSPPVRTVPQAAKPEAPRKDIVPQPPQKRPDRPGVVATPSEPPRTETTKPPSETPGPAILKERILNRTPDQGGGMAPPRMAERPDVPKPPKKEKEKKKTEKKRYRSPCTPCYPGYYGYPGMYGR